MLNKRATFSTTVFFALCAMLATIAFGLILGLGAAQEKTVKKVPIKYTDPSSAKEMYNAYCAVCHGVDGKGGGPAASEFKTPPTDLTVLAKNNGGKYPNDKVYAILKFGTSAPAHGTLEMPIWIDLFHSVDANDTTPKLRMHNLVEYIQNLQVK
jgi:mono/diheme cytochrome c family protein